MARPTPSNFREGKQAVLGAQKFQLAGAVSADQGMARARNHGRDKEEGARSVGGKGIIIERRTAGYIDGGGCETGGAGRQILIRASSKRQTICGRAKPPVDGRDPGSGGGPTGAKPQEGSAETGGGPANRKSTEIMRALKNCTNGFVK